MDHLLSRAQPSKNQVTAEEPARRPFFSRATGGNRRRVEDVLPSDDLRLNASEYVRTGEYRLASWLALGGL